MPLLHRIARRGLQMAAGAARRAVDAALERPVAVNGGTNGHVVAMPRPTTGSGVLVRFDGDGEGRIPSGATILEAAELLDIDLDHFCGGNCSCGTCVVDILDGASNLSKLDSMEQAVLGRHQARGRRLACQTRVHGPIRVSIPEFG
jgi:ferredoxin